MIASHPALGKLPRWDVFDESKGRWEPKGEGAMLLWPGEGRLFRVRGVTSLRALQNTRRSVLPPNARREFDDLHSDEDNERNSVYDQRSSPLYPPPSSSPAPLSPVRLHATDSTPRPPTFPISSAPTVHKTSLQHKCPTPGPSRSTREADPDPRDIIELTDSEDEADFRRLFMTPPTAGPHAWPPKDVKQPPTSSRASSKGKGRAIDPLDVIELTDHDSEDPDSDPFLGSPTKRPRLRYS